MLLPLLMNNLLAGVPPAAEERYPFITRDARRRIVIPPFFHLPIFGVKGLWLTIQHSIQEVAET